MAIQDAVTSEQIERLRTPQDWRDTKSESPLITREKIRRAHELGVVAVVFTADQVAKRIKELALLEHTLRNGSVDNTVYAAVMKGGIPFAAALFREIAALSPSMNPVVDYIQATRYGASQSGKSKLEVVRGLDPGTDSKPGTDINGKRFVGIDDTIDEGITMQLLGEAAMDPVACRQLGQAVTGPATELGIITLTDKEIAELHNYPPESVTRGFWLPNVWAGGNGLDGPSEAMRWVPELVITPVQHEKYRDVMPEVLDILGQRAIMGMNDISWIS